MIHERSVFAETELLALPEETLKTLIKNPLLKDWDYELISTLKSRAHIISADGERVLALAGDATKAPWPIILNSFRAEDRCRPSTNFALRGGVDLTTTESFKSTINEFVSSVKELEKLA